MTIADKLEYFTRLLESGLITKEQFFLFIEREPNKKLLENIIDE